MFFPRFTPNNHVIACPSSSGRTSPGPPGAGCLLLPHPDQLPPDCLHSTSREPHPVDDRLIFHQSKDARLLVAFLGTRRDRSNLQVSKSKCCQPGYGDPILVIPCRQPDRVPEAQPQHFHWLFRHREHPFQQPADGCQPACPPNGMQSQPMGGFRIKLEQHPAKERVHFHLCILQLCNCPGNPRLAGLRLFRFLNGADHFLLVRIGEFLESHECPGFR